MALISISNDKNANWSEFERNPCENRRFQIFIAGTPDWRRTFFVFALTPLRVVGFSIFQLILVERFPNSKNQLKNRKSDHQKKSYGLPKLRYKNFFNYFWSKTLKNAFFTIFSSKLKWKPPFLTFSKNFFDIPNFTHFRL